MAIQSHIILNFGGLGVTFFVGIRFILSDPFDISIGFVVRLLSLCAFVIFLFGIATKVFNTEVFALIRFKYMDYHVYKIQQYPFSVFQSFLAPGLLPQGFIYFFLDGSG